MRELINFIEECAEEIENVYGKDTDKSDRLRKLADNLRFVPVYDWGVSMLSKEEYVKLKDIRNALCK